MTMLAAPPTTTHWRLSDLRAAAQLATQATHRVTDIVEGVHQSVLGTLGSGVDARSMNTGGLTGLIYRSIHGITGGIAGGLDFALRHLPKLPDADDSERRLGWISVLNGVMGDHLAASNNPLALHMSFNQRGLRIDPGSLSAPSGKILLLVHGLCMNDQRWRSDDEQGGYFDHGLALAESLGYTPVYLRYNSGLHVSLNGRELAAQLEQLLAQWPQPIQQLAIIGHSMGGLVARSALHYATEAQLQWPQQLRHLVFLGTPHHGSPLERAGNWVDTILAQTPYSAPFARLGQLRSAGITDLRHGYSLDQDWQDHDRFQQRADCRQPLPLPSQVSSHAIAATLASKRGALSDRLTGDGLVPVHSALGRHPEGLKTLAFAVQSQHILYRTGHLGLLRSRPALTQMQRWLDE